MLSEDEPRPSRAENGADPKQSAGTVGAEYLPDGVAPEFRDRLAGLMMRIPARWGRYLSYDRGWDRIVAELSDSLARLSPYFEVHQVKEKFGSLRFYAEPGALSCDLTEDVRQEFRRLIGEAEGKSASTCDVCGADGELCAYKGGSWVATRCPNCRQSPGGSGRVFVPVGD